MKTLKVTVEESPEEDEGVDLQEVRELLGYLGEESSGTAKSK